MVSFKFTLNFILINSLAFSNIFFYYVCILLYVMVLGLKCGRVNFMMLVYVYIILFCEMLFLHCLMIKYNFCGSDLICLLIWLPGVFHDFLFILMIGWLIDICKLKCMQITIFICWKYDIVTNIFFKQRLRLWYSKGTYKYHQSREDMFSFIYSKVANIKSSFRLSNLLLLVLLRP